MGPDSGGSPFSGNMGSGVHNPRKRIGPDQRTDHAGPRRVESRNQRPDTRPQPITPDAFNKVLAKPGVSTHDPNSVPLDTLVPSALDILDRSSDLDIRRIPLSERSKAWHGKVTSSATQHSPLDK